MRALTIVVIGSLSATAALAQTAATPNRPAAPTHTTSAPNASTGTPPAGGVVDRNTGTAAASGDRNQAVATTDANAPQPAHGRNSFTEGEARRRIERNGFAQVTGLKKDTDGVWRGTATKGGSQVKVWLDYKGNVGAS